VKVTQKTLITGKLNNLGCALAVISGRPFSADYRRGFTLLELIVVCALIGIMLVVSAPTLRNAFIDDQLKATSRRVIGFVNGVRELAAREQQSYFLNIDRNENQIWYEKDVKIAVEEKDNNLQKLIFPPEIQLSEIWTKSEGIYSEDQNRIWVNRKGYMDQTVLHLEDDAGNVISLHFSPFVESVGIYDEYTLVD